MKPVKNFVFAALLVSSLAFNTFGGDVETPGAPSSQPPKAMSTYDDGIPTGDSNEPAGDSTTETSNYLLFEALAALLSVY